MLYPGLPCGFAFKFDNWGANPSSTFGVLATANASANVEGAWIGILTSAEISKDCYWVYVVVHTGAVSASARNTLLDIGVDPAGGTSYSAIISNVVCGDSPAVNQAGIKSYLFPFFIKAGSSFAVRIQSSVASATCRVGIRVYGAPTNPLVNFTGSISQTFGTITNSNGQSFTPGNAADGAWTSLGTTSTSLWWWQLGYQIDNGTISAEYTWIEVAWGDGSNKHIITKMVHGGTSAEVAAAITDSGLAGCEAYMPVPAGATIYIRGRCNNAPDTGYNATVIGIGG